MSAGKSTLGTGQTLGTNTTLYQLAGGTSYTNPNGDFHDITSGSNGNPAKVGYDVVTGLGSPAAHLIPDLVGPITTTPTPIVIDNDTTGYSQTPVGAGRSGTDRATTTTSKKPSPATGRPRPPGTSPA